MFPPSKAPSLEEESLPEASFAEEFSSSSTLGAASGAGFAAAFLAGCVLAEISDLEAYAFLVVLGESEVN